MPVDLARLEPPRRIPGIDLARALAVIGMFAAHLLTFDYLFWSEPATWRGVVDGRSSILFATLAGVSLALTASPRLGQPRDDRLRTDLRLAARAGLIWLLGLLLLLLGTPVYVILQAYGILFLIAILLRRLSDGALLCVALGTACLGPILVQLINTTVPSDDLEAEPLFISLGWHYPFVGWVAFIAAGIMVGRFLRHVTARRAALAAGTGGLLALIGYGVIGPVGNRVADAATQPTTAWSLAVLQDRPHSTGIGEMIGSGGFAIAVIGVCVLTTLTRLRWALWPLRAMGSMPLSAYAAHLLIWGLWLGITAGGLGVEGPGEADAFLELNPFWPLTVVMIIGCSLWALLIGRGPLETLLARLVDFFIARTPASRLDIRLRHNGK